MCAEGNTLNAAAPLLAGLWTVCSTTASIPHALMGSLLTPSDSGFDGVQNAFLRPSPRMDTCWERVAKQFLGLGVRGTFPGGAWSCKGMSCQTAGDTSKLIDEAHRAAEEQAMLASL
jgi:hypothetical protein